MVSIKIRTLGLVALVAAGSAVAVFACPNNDNKSASYASSQKGDCAAHAGMAKGECPYASKASATVASTEHMSCGMSKSAVAAGACSAHDAASCTFGKNSVTMSGATCPTAHEADYAFAVNGADCQGSSESAAKAIHAVKGVASVTVDYAHHMAYVCCDGRACGKDAIAGSLKKAGFDGVKFVSQDKSNCAKSHGKVQA